jgi:hypothetical protein
MPNHPGLPIVPLFILLVFVAAAVIFVKFVLQKLGGAKFALKSPLLSTPEQTLYHRLVEALPNHIVLAQVAFSQLVTVVGGDSKENFRKNLTARQKVADFVVCDKSFSVLAVVELDDSTHSAAKDEKRDAIITEAGSRTIRWRVGRLPTADDIKRQVLGA